MNTYLTMHEKIEDLIVESGKHLEQIAKEISEQYCPISKALLSNMANSEKKEINFGYKYIVAVAKYFNVSTDYLLTETDIKTNDIETKKVCEYTGLSEKAIEKLHKKEWRSKDIISMAVDEMVNSIHNPDSITKKYTIDGKLMFDSFIENEFDYILSHYTTVANDFICSDEFDEIISSYISQENNSTSVNTMKRINENEVEVDELSNEQLNRLYSEVVTLNSDRKKIDLFNAQNSALEFVKKAITYNDKDLITAIHLTDYIDSILTFRENGKENE